jgi:hypothetical protein
MIQDNQRNLKYQIAFYDASTDSMEPIATMLIDREDFPLDLGECSVIRIKGKDYYGQSDTLPVVCEPEKQTITIYQGVLKVE